MLDVTEMYFDCTDQVTDENLSEKQNMQTDSFFRYLSSCKQELASPKKVKLYLTMRVEIVCYTALQYEFDNIVIMN